MVTIGFTRAGYDQYMEAFESGACMDHPQNVIDTILKEGCAVYHSDEGKMFYFDKYDLEKVY